MVAVLVGAGLAISACAARAQNFSTPTVQPAAANAPDSQMVYGVPQIIRLSQAKVSDDTILAYVNNGGICYNLDADQIIYLRQKGVSDAIITAMLNHPKAVEFAYAPPTPAPQPVAPASNPSPAASTYTASPTPSYVVSPAPTYTAPAPMVTVAPTVTYVQTVPAPVYYYPQPCYQPCYYPSFGFFPALSLSFAWGSGGGGWHGGGYHGGGGWHH